MNEAERLPPHLREDAPVLRCTVCGRKSWTGLEAGLHCNMPQPDDRRCAGTMQPAGMVLFAGQSNTDNWLQAIDGIPEEKK